VNRILIAGAGPAPIPRDHLLRHEGCGIEYSWPVADVVENGTGTVTVVAADDIEYARLGTRLLGVHDPGRPWRMAHASMHDERMRTSDPGPAPRRPARHHRRPGPGPRRAAEELDDHVAPVRDGMTARRFPPPRHGGDRVTARKLARPGMEAGVA
jgi:hypothetical protein